MSRCPVPKSDADVRWFSSNWRGDDLNPAQCSGFGRLCWEGAAVCLTGSLFCVAFICSFRALEGEAVGEGFRHREMGDWFEMAVLGMGDIKVKVAWWCSFPSSHHKTLRHCIS